MQHLLTVNERQVSYQSAGKGPCVMLLHGFGEDSRIWTAQIAFLEKSFHVIAPDLPGSGASDLIEDMHIEGLAHFVYEILQKEQIEKCVLVGHSMGGYVTLAFADAYPEKLTGFGLFHSTAYSDSEEKKDARRKGMQLIAEKGAAAFLQTSTLNLFSAATKATQPSLIEGHLKSISYFTKEALIAYYQAMILRPDRVGVLQKSKVPVLFILGEQDTAVPLQDGLRQCYQPSVSYVEILRSSAHMGLMEEAGASNTILKNFLAML